MAEAMAASRPIVVTRVSERLEMSDSALSLIATAHLLPGNDATVVARDAASRGEAHPKRRIFADVVQADERNGKKYHVGDCVKHAGGVIDDLKRLLRAVPNQTGQRKEQGDGPNKEDGIDRCPVPFMQTRKPGGKKLIPPGDHGKARTAGEINAHHGNGACNEEQDRHRNQRAHDWP
jgi:hypothetical protein